MSSGKPMSRKQGSRSKETSTVTSISTSTDPEVADKNLTTATAGQIPNCILVDTETAHLNCLTTLNECINSLFDGRFPFDKVVAEPERGANKNIIVLEASTISSDNEEQTKKRVFCATAVKGVCERGIGCKYGHPYEFDGLTKLSLKLDYIIDKLNKLEMNMEPGSAMSQEPSEKNDQGPSRGRDRRGSSRSTRRGDSRRSSGGERQRGRSRDSESDRRETNRYSKSYYRANRSKSRSSGSQVENLQRRLIDHDFYK